METEARAAVRSTRKQLPHGPGNIEAAIVASQGESAELAIAARWIRSERGFRSRGGGVLDKEVDNAASAIIAGGGNCSEHAAVAFFELIKTGSKGIMLNLVVADLDHAFVVAGDLADLTHAYVIDAWSPGNTASAEISGWCDVLRNKKYNVPLQLKTDGTDYVQQRLRGLDDTTTLLNSGLKKARKELFANESISARDFFTDEGQEELIKQLKQSKVKIFGDSYDIPSSWA